VHLFSNYPRAGSPESTNCTVWEAGLATGAAPTFLDPIKINGRTYVDGGIAANNPVEVCIKEAQRLFPDREIGAIVSLGCGLQQRRQRRSPTGVPGIVSTMETVIGHCVSSEEAHRSVLEQLGVVGCSPAELEGSYRLGYRGPIDRDRCSKSMRALLAPDAIYVRLNPELDFKWQKAGVEIDTKHPLDLANLQRSADTFMRGEWVQEVMETLPHKLQLDHCEKGHADIHG